jgi:S-(hydroxymethyl)mycothiol dehydrogenase
MSETANVSRGDSVAVIGRGGVGAAVALGATRTVNATDTDAVERVRELTGGYGADVVVDAVGRPETWAQAFTTMHAGGVLRFVVVL